MEKQSLDDLIRRANGAARLVEMDKQREMDLQQMREQEMQKAEMQKAGIEGMMKKYLREDEQDQSEAGEKK